MASLYVCMMAGLALLAAAHAHGGLSEGAGLENAGPLFTGFEGPFASPQPVADAARLRGELVGIIVDGAEIAMELVYRDGDTFYLPAELLARMGVTGRGSGTKLYLNTPGGEVRVEASRFRDINGRTYFEDALLHEVLKIRWEFSREKYAFNLTLPWWERGASKARVFDGEGEVDVAPSSFGVTQIRLDHSQFANRQSDYSQSDLLVRGRLGGGIWRGEVQGISGREVLARDYYWMKDFSHVQALVGNQEVLINPLLPVVETTGAQALFSSKPLEFDPYQDQTRSQYIRRFGIPARDIEGVSQPGAIAELRVDERPIARVRVNLDGTYRFDRVKANSLQFQTLRVHILDQRSFVELEVQDFTRTPMDLLLDGGQTVAFGGVGIRGNPLDPVRGSGGEAAFGLYRYGLSDNLTLEAGLQSAGGEFHQTAGLSASLGRNWAATVSAGHRAGTYGYMLDVFGRADRWQVTARSQNFGAGFRTPASRKTRFDELRFEYWLTRSLSLGVHGRARENVGRRSEYLLPGATWRFGRRNLVKVWPDFDGEYRVDVRTAYRQRDWFEFVHDSAGQRAEYRYFRSQNLEFFGRLRRQDFDGSSLGELGGIWYPNEYDDRSLLAASVLAGDGGAGYRFTWQTTILPGLFSHLELRDEPVRTEFADPGLQLRWTLSVDLAISGGRPVPARNDFVQTRLGSIAGRLTLPDGTSLRSEGVDRVSILVDGRPHTAVLRGRYFFVRNIPPGVYEVSLGSEYLPMSFSPVKARYRVKVASAATSTVDFVVQREFGLAGRVLDGHDVGIASVAVAAHRADGTLVGTAYTDAYGYYRFAGLVPGTYRLRVNDPEAPPVVLNVEVVDAFVFDADMVLAAPGETGI